MKNLLHLCLVFVLCVSACSQADDAWKPVKGQIYPDIDLIDQNGRQFKLSDYKGKVIVIEPVGMNCPACQAFSGAHNVGSFENNAVQTGLSSAKELFPRYTDGMEFPNPDVVFVQILFYDMRFGAPKPEDAKKWAKHFKFDQKDNEIVAVPLKDMRSSTTYNMIPGFQLLDRSFVLKSDSSGHHPQDNMYKTLIPMIPKLL